MKSQLDVKMYFAENDVIFFFNTLFYWLRTSIKVKTHNRVSFQTCFHAHTNLCREICNGYMLYKLLKPSLITWQQNSFPSCETFVLVVFKNI